MKCRYISARHIEIMKKCLVYKISLPKDTELKSSKYSHMPTQKSNHILNIFYIYSTKAMHCKLFFYFLS